MCMYSSRIDATRTSAKLHICHIANDRERRKANAVMKKLVVNKKPHLALFATRAIQPGDEICYDYGDDAENLWWRKSSEVNGLTLCQCICLYRNHSDVIMSCDIISYCVQQLCIDQISCMIFIENYA